MGEGGGGSETDDQLTAGAAGADVGRRMLYLGLVEDDEADYSSAAPVTFADNADTVGPLIPSIHVLDLRSFSQRIELVDEYIAHPRRSIVLDISRAPRVDSERLTDFIVGMTQGSQGHIEEIQSGLYLLMKSRPRDGLSRERRESLRPSAHSVEILELSAASTPGQAVLQFLADRSFCVRLPESSRTRAALKAVDRRALDFLEGLNLGGNGVAEVSGRLLLIAPIRALQNQDNSDIIGIGTRVSRIFPESFMDRLEVGSTNSNELDTPLSPEELLAAVVAGFEALDRAKLDLQTRVDSARRAGIAWAAIGGVVGISQQAAYQRWSATGKETNRRNQADRRRRLTSGHDTTADDK